MLSFSLTPSDFNYFFNRIEYYQIQHCHVPVAMEGNNGFARSFKKSFPDPAKSEKRKAKSEKRKAKSEKRKVIAYEKGLIPYILTD